MTKYQEYFQDMMNTHSQLFSEFGSIHEAYSANPKKFEKEFNQKGQEVLEVIRRYENMLCSTSEGGKYGKFSTKLSEKFWEGIRAIFPKIDFVGVKFS